MAQNESENGRKERIAKMEADGVISTAQAQLLYSSLYVEGPKHSGRKITGQLARTQHWGMYFILICLIVAIAWLITSGGSESTIQNVSETINQSGGTGEMNNSLANFFAVLLILAIPIGLLAWFYNSIISKEEAVFSSWAQVESSYQRRSDLIPSLVDTVSRYLTYEADTLTRVTETRSAGVSDFNSVVEELINAQAASADLLGQGDEILDNAAALAALQQAQGQVGGRMMRLFALVENYPELNSSDQFLELQGQLEGTENRINVARIRFNDAVEAYNQAIRRLPGSLVAGLGNFQRKAYFQADEGAENASELDFQ